jgi:hypothetical protein
MDVETIGLIDSLSKLGLSAILLYFIVTIWKSRREELADKDKVIAEKDKAHDNLANSVMEVVKENTKSNVLLKSSIDAQTKALEAQQQDLKTLTNRVYEILVK